MANYDDGYAAEKVDSQHDAKHLEVSADSQLALAADFEDHEMGIWKSFVRYPWACAWCVYACWTIILLSFDVQAAGAVVGIPEFRKDFGYEFNGDYVLPAIWQSAFSGAPIATAVISSIASAELADYIGRKKVLALALIISFVAVAIEFIATTNPVFFAGKLLNGFMVEITPLALRGIFTCGVGVAYGIGPLVAFIVINYTGTVESRWAYRTVFCCQFGFAGVSAVLWPFMPESPWWLVSKGKKGEALKSLGRLGHSGNEGRAKLALIERTLDEVKAETDGVTYLECFKKSNLRRTIISIMPLCIQSFSGIAFVASYFTCQYPAFLSSDSIFEASLLIKATVLTIRSLDYLQLAGYSTSMSYQLQIAQPVLSIVGNLMAAAVIDKVGRRNLTFYGLAILTVFLLITGGLGTGTSQPMIKGTVAFILIYSWWYNVSIGSTAFSLLAEVSTSRLRAKTVAIGYASQNSINVMWQFVIPYMFNPDKANLGAKIAFIFGGLCLFSLAYLWLFQPETGGRSYEELDEMFAKGVPARKFKSYKTTVQLRNETSAQDGSH
ncbi:maltose permease MAL31 [Colletotrichum scovillei]|uniref:maltose permease MAL31 n=1 Tax=Colletotrichum scovillei TaxID=1209932 RepID=UPI0015C31C45|nr:maltose permease MAL31 [Colletotrichum scovillei]KAF4783337.1 maltose permease MAL31 [Colletotrichum scovillei]